MKQLSSILTITFFCLFLLPLTGQNLTFQPSSCSPGDKVNISYNAEGSDLEDIKDFDVIVYQVTDEGLVAEQLFTKIKNGSFKAPFNISKETKSIFIKLATEDGKHKDDNDGKGYIMKMKTQDKSAKVPGAYASIADIYGKYYRSLGLERDYTKALKYMKKEFKNNIESKKDNKYVLSYANYASKAEDEESIADVKGILESLQLRKDQTEEKLMLMHNLLGYTGQDKAKAELGKVILEEYPNGKMAVNNSVSTFRKAKTIEEKVNIYNSLPSDKSEKSSQQIADYFAGAIATDYANKGDWQNFDMYFSKIKDALSKSRSLNGLAWKMSGESVDAEAPNASKGAELSRQSLELVKATLHDVDLKPASMTKKQWKNQMDYTYAMFSDTYALLQYHNGNFEDAFNFQKISAKTYEFKDGDMNERFAFYLEKAHGPEKTEKKLEWLIKEGNATAKMKEQYQRIFMANNTLESAYTKHLAALESVANDKLREELKEKMINEKAPEFQLVNLKGENVSLSSMKGKVVVLDFWATWCGPCKASFPGMQKAVEKYADNENVEFLFLDTWERVENKEENASKFIEKNAYTFNVLMDNDNKVVTDYKVSGIPTKFIVDKNGMIRFKSIGFSGSNEGLVSELILMIDLATNASTDSISSAP